MSSNIRLTSSEIGTLWSQYINDTAAICMNTHVLKIVLSLLRFRHFRIEGEDWSNIMIKYGWLEQVPQAPDRKALAEEKK